MGEQSRCDDSPEDLLRGREMFGDAIAANFFSFQALSQKNRNEKAIINDQIMTS